MFNTRALGRAFVTKRDVTEGRTKTVAMTNAWFSRQDSQQHALPCSGYCCPQHGGGMFLKNKLQLRLSTPSRHTGGAEVQLHSFLPSALKKKLGGQLHAAAALTPGKYPLNRRPDGLQSCSGRFGEKISSLFRNSNPRIVQPVQKTHTKFWL